jgi:hypothetical protein
MADNRIVFHYNRKHNEDQSIPPWIVKTKGLTHQVHHFTSEVGFSTKETPDNPATKGSLMLRGTLTLLHRDGKVEAVITP